MSYVWLRQNERRHTFQLTIRYRVSSAIEPNSVPFRDVAVLVFINWKV